jgi:hypothetical protein
MTIYTSENGLQPSKDGPDGQVKIRIKLETKLTQQIRELTALCERLETRIAEAKEIEHGLRKIVYDADNLITFGPVPGWDRKQAADLIPGKNCEVTETPWTAPPGFNSFADCLKDGSDSTYVTADGTVMHTYAPRIGSATEIKTMTQVAGSLHSAGSYQLDGVEVCACCDLTAELCDDCVVYPCLGRQSRKSGLSVEAVSALLAPHKRFVEAGPGRGESWYYAKAVDASGQLVDIQPPYWASAAERMFDAVTDGSPQSKPEPPKSEGNDMADFFKRSAHER